ncbi:MAG: PAS domain-containing sensor histidine kinase [Fulvivirga sp.]|nr:PAS domain-containing sensor histidine kinase [Fulvivirga sp.]
MAIFSSAESYATGIDLYYLIICIAAITLFDYKSLKVGFLIAFLSVATYVLLATTEIQFIEDIVIYDESLETVFLINFTICVISAMMLFYFMMSTSNHTEEIMKNTEKSLMYTTYELAESKRKFELALKGSSAGIWEWNIKEKRLFISHQVMKMLDHTVRDRRNISEEEFKSYFHPDDLPYVWSKLMKHLEERQHFEVECRIRKKNGEYIWVLDTGQAEWNSKDEPVIMVGSLVDITERKQAEQELQEKNEMLRKANEELDRFVYSTSHDLRAPLSSVLGLISLAETSDDQEEKTKCIAMMKERVQTLNSFISDITNYSRNSRADVVIGEVELNEIITGILNNLEHFENQKSIKIIKDLPDQFMMNSDKSRLRVILNNLITNAIKYHDLEKRSPYIKISAFQSNGHVQIHVEDNGQGIEEEYQDKIFNMFYRATADSEGSGLGLYIAKEMTEKLKGNLEVRTKYGKGSVFSLELPVDYEG